MTPIFWHNSISSEIVGGDVIIQNAEIARCKVAYYGIFRVKTSFLAESNIDRTAVPNVMSNFPELILRNVIFTAMLELDF